jgi:hypothetical protein
VMDIKCSPLFLIVFYARTTRCYTEDILAGSKGHMGHHHYHHYHWLHWLLITDNPPSLLLLSLTFHDEHKVQIFRTCDQSSWQPIGWFLKQCRTCSLCVSLNIETLEDFFLTDIIVQCRAHC